MLLSYNDDLIIKLDNVKAVTVCISKFPIRPIMQVVETKDGNNLVFNQSIHFTVDSFGYTYFKSNNMKLKTYVKEDSLISRVAICTSNFFKKRIIEIIEFTDGTLLISPLSKSIIIERVDSDYIASEAKRVMNL